MYLKLSSGEGTSPFAYTTRAGPPPAPSEPTPLQRCCERSLTDIPRFDRTELYCGPAERHDGPILRRNYTVRFVSAISVIPAFYIIQSLTLVLIFLSDHLYSSFCSLPNSHGLLLYYVNPPFPPPSSNWQRSHIHRSKQIGGIKSILSRGFFLVVCTCTARGTTGEDT